jgi:HEAT repeat protein
MRATLLILATVMPAALSGQTLEQRLRAVPQGTVHLSFAARPGVCGGGANNINIREPTDEWETDCENQPVRVSLELAAGRVVAVRTYVGGRWRQGIRATDLGTVRSQEAAAYLLDLASRPGDLDGDPVLPASLADSVVIWPALLRIARTQQLPEERRRTAVFWLSQAAGEAATRTLDSIAVDDRGDREVRKQAVFALSQRSGNQGVPALIRIARTNTDPELRKTALFWLGQSDDPRAIDLFEEILR